MLNPISLKSLSLLSITIVLLVFSNDASAQRLSKTPIQLHRSDAMPGVVGREMAATKPSLRGHFQSVELIGPKGSRIRILGENNLQPESNVKTGMLIGEVYRMKVTGIPRQEGMEVYPTVEIINRLYTPEGKESKFPIPVHLTTEDLTNALNGAFVTRVVYLEDPRNAIPLEQSKGEQTVWDVDNEQDPLHVADRMGRPMAIVRIGSRIPEDALGQAADGFNFGSPPLMEMPELPEIQEGPETAPSEPLPFAPQAKLQPKTQTQQTQPIRTTTIPRTNANGFKASGVSLRMTSGK